jgi:hypothetical protein
MMQLIINPTGKLRGIYSEEIDLHVLGSVEIRRASRVEPDEFGSWWADLSPVNGPRQGPFPHRSQAIAAELQWLRDHWMIS